MTAFAESASVLLKKDECIYSFNQYGQDKNLTSNTSIDVPSIAIQSVHPVKSKVFCHAPFLNVLILIMEL